MLLIPNGKLSNAVITNVTSEPLRRVDITVGIEYSQDVDRVKAILSDIATNDELVLKDHPVDIYIDSFASSSVTIGFRVWTEKDNYWAGSNGICRKVSRKNLIKTTLQYHLTSWM